MREQICQIQVVVGIVFRDPGQDIDQPFTRININRLAATKQRVHYCGILSSIMVSTEHKILSSESQGPERIFHAIIIWFIPTIQMIVDKEESTTGSGLTSDAPEIVTRLREANKGKSLEQLNDLYFNLLQKIEAAYKNDDINNVLMHCQASLGLLEPLIQYTKKDYGSFDIQTIPSLDYALLFFSISGSIGQLKNIQDIVEYIEELHPYKEAVEAAFSRSELAKNIYQYVKTNPDCVQKDLKTNLNHDDGNFIRNTVYYMEKMGQLTRTKKAVCVL